MPEPVPLKGLPMPPAVVVLAVITAIAFVVGLTRLPHALSLGITYEHAKADLANGKPEEAVKLMAPLLAQYPEATALKLDLARAYLQSNDIDNAIKLVEDFEGKKVSKEENDTLDQLASEINARMSSIPHEMGAMHGPNGPHKGPNPFRAGAPNLEDQ